MCGLAGFFKLQKNAVLSPEWINGMMDAIAHRGPDDHGNCLFRFDGCIQKDLFDEKDQQLTDPDGVFGFQRLSIIDKSFNGHQPMVCDEDGIVVLFNGEIYNADELRAELQSLGVVFSGLSDTEVILQLYRFYNLRKMLIQLKGMFAIVILDIRTNTVFLIRDRMGIKPLYYTTERELLLFASEMKAFRKCDIFTPELNEAAIWENVLFRSPFNANLFKNITCVKPGTYIKVHEGKITEHVYFSLDSIVRLSSSDISFEEAEERFFRALYNSVARQVKADVPVGFQLSGGVDSSAIAYIESMLQKRCFGSYSIYVMDSLYSEEQYINQIINTFRITPHSYRFGQAEAMASFLPAIYHLDTINTHFNALGFYYLAANASKDVKVLLGGEGADELMGGYYQFAEGRDVSSYLQDHNNWNKEKDLDYFGFLPRDYASYAILKGMHVSKNECFRLLDMKDKWTFEARTELFHSFHGSDFDKHVKYEVAIHLSDLLMKQDRMAMANGIENRVPFLDDDMVILCMSIPESYWIHPDDKGVLTGKYLLKHLISSVLGRPFAFRKKMGFPLPIRTYMESAQFQKLVFEQLIFDMQRRSLFRKDEIIRQLRNIDTISDQQVIALWKVINLEAWIQMMI